MGGRPGGSWRATRRQLGGILTNDSADKAARFIELCDAFGIPLVFLQDVPGFMVGTKVEKEGIIRHGAKMLFAVARATVPKLTVVVRKGYGAGYYVMDGKRLPARSDRRLADRRDLGDGAEGAVEISSPAGQGAPRTPPRRRSS